MTTASRTRARKLIADRTSADRPVGGSGSQRVSRLGDYGNRFGLLVAWLILILIFGALEPDSFLSTANFQSILSSQSVLVLLSLSLLPSLMLGGLDLSVASVLTISVTIVGWLNVTQGLPIGIAILCALGAGLLIGLLNALIIVGLDIDPIVVTLGMGTAVQGAALGINNVAVSGISPGLVSAMRTQIFGLQAVFFYVLALTTVMWYVLRFTPLGRYMYFSGAGPAVSRLAGIPTRRIHFGSYIFGGFMAALAGVFLAGVLGSADPTVGSTYLLPAFAAVFLGATTITPGRFNPWGTWISVYFLATGVTGFEFLGWAGWTREVFYGGALILALVVPRLIGRNGRSG